MSILNFSWHGFYEYFCCCFGCIDFFMMWLYMSRAFFSLEWKKIREQREWGRTVNIFCSVSFFPGYARDPICWCIGSEVGAHTLKAISLVPSRSLQRMLVYAHKLVVMKLMVNTFFQSYIFMQKSFFIGGGGSGDGVVVGVAFGIHWKPNILFICYFNSFKMGGFTLCFFHGINISWFYDCFGIAHIHELTLNRVPNRKKSLFLGRNTSAPHLSSTSNIL